MPPGLVPPAWLLLILLAVTVQVQPRGLARHLLGRPTCANQAGRRRRAACNRHPLRLDSRTTTALQRGRRRRPGLSPEEQWWVVTNRQSPSDWELPRAVAPEGRPPAGRSFLLFPWVATPIRHTGAIRHAINSTPLTCTVAARRTWRIQRDREVRSRHPCGTVRQAARAVSATATRSRYLTHSPDVRGSGGSGSSGPGERECRERAGSSRPDAPPPDKQEEHPCPRPSPQLSFGTLQKRRHPRRRPSRHRRRPAGGAVNPGRRLAAHAGQRWDTGDPG